MNRKINTICFIFLFVFLISAVSAANIENETSTNIQQPDPDQDLCKVSVESKEDSFYADKKLCANQNTNSKQTKETVYLTAPNVKMHYKDGTIFKVTLKDKNKSNT